MVARDWEKTRRVHVDVIDSIEDGWKEWLMFSEAKLPLDGGPWKKAATDEVAMLRVDQGKNFGFSRIASTKV
jgi:hypothetical protein